MQFTEICSCGKPIEPVYVTTGLCETCWSVEQDRLGCPSAFSISAQLKAPPTKRHNDDDFEHVPDKYVQLVDQRERQHRAEEQQHKRRWAKAHAI